jgi:hypothetical protein
LQIHDVAPLPLQPVNIEAGLVVLIPIFPVTIVKVLGVTKVPIPIFPACAILILSVEFVLKINGVEPIEPIASRILFPDELNPIAVKPTLFCPRKVPDAPAP